MSISAGKVTGLTAGTSQLYANGLVISNPTTANDVGWIRVTGTGEADTVLEIATGDDGGSSNCEKIVARQYNTSNAVAREAVLLNTDGKTSFPVSVTAPTFMGSLSDNDGTMKIYSEVNNEINFGGSNNSSTIHFGHRAKDSKPIPTKFVFGNVTGTAELVAAKFTGALNGNASTADTLATARTINNVSFNGSKDITIFSPRETATVSATLKTPGWYRVATINNTYCVLNMNLSGAFNYSNAT
jgi:hypothetical protein